MFDDELSYEKAVDFMKKTHTEFDKVQAIDTILHDIPDSKEKNKLKEHIIQMSNNRRGYSHSKPVYKFDAVSMECIDSYDSLVEAARHNNITHAYQVRESIETGKELHGFRWAFSDTLQKDNPQQTTQPKLSKRYGLIAQIDPKMNIITNVYANQLDACKAINLTSGAMSIAIKAERPAAKFLWKFYEDCSDELKSTYQGTLPEVPMKTGNFSRVDKVDPISGDVVHTYNSMSEIVNKEKICHKTIKKVSESGAIYKGFVWRIV